jgi:hypothetical protein
MARRSAALLLLVLALSIRMKITTPTTAIKPSVRRGNMNSSSRKRPIPRTQAIREPSQLADACLYPSKRRVGDRGGFRGMKLLPWLPGLIPAAGALLNALAVQVGWQALYQHPVWLALPWDWIGVAAGFYLAGILVAQLQNPRSPLRSWFRDRRRLFDFKVFATLGVAEPERVQLVAVLTSRRDTKPLPLAVWGDPLVEFETEQRLLHKAELPAMRRGERHRVDLGALMIPRPGWTPRHSVFGHESGSDGLPHLSVSIVPNSGWLVHFDVGGQAERFLVWVRDFKQTNGLGMVVATPDEIARAATV